MDVRTAIQEIMPLTVGEMIQIATDYQVAVTDVVLMEAELQLDLPREVILEQVKAEYEHNLRAIDIGMENGDSILLGTIASQLARQEGFKFFSDKLLDDALMFTLGAQVGNHCIGLRPCAGTGDSCPYSGFIKALQVNGYGEDVIWPIAALLIKIGGIFRVGKVSTGCNMEGFGAGSPSVAAAMVALMGGTPRQMEKAMVMAISPTIAVPCTPRVLVPALCTTHVDGAILIGMFSAKLAMSVDIEVNVPFDVMIAMASEVHIESARHVVPTVVDYMEPFFKRKAPVEALISDEVKAEEQKHIEATLVRAKEVSKKMAMGTTAITKTLGDAVVGGSSQAVGSPTNAARIVHELAEGEIKKVRVELYPELFARRAINIPGVLMGAVFGSSTSDYAMYNVAVNKVRDMGIEVEIVEGNEEQIQRITIVTDKMTAMVDTLNRGGGRLVLRNAEPSLEKAKEAAQRLGIVLV